MRTPTTLFLALLALPLLAGCIDEDEEDDGDGPPLAPYPYATFRCGDGSAVIAESAAEGTGSRCNVRVTGNGPGNNGPANELTIAVDPQDPMRLVAGGKDYTLGLDDQCGVNRVWAGYYWSQDGGYTWNNELMQGHDQVVNENRPDEPLAGYHCTTDPVTYWDWEGRAYYSGLSYAQRRTEQDAPPPVGTYYPGDVAGNVCLAVSEDGGATYTPRLVAQADGLATFHDKQWFTVDQVTGNIYFTWSVFVFTPPVPGAVPVTVPPDAPTYVVQIVFTKSTDGGVNWSPLQVLYEEGPFGMESVPAPERDKQFSTPAVDKEGNVYVTWMVEAKGEIWFTKSLDQGETWTDAKRIVTGLNSLPSPLPPTAFRAGTYPVLAIDRSEDAATAHALYLVFSELNGTQAADVYLVRSLDRGESWSLPERIHDDGGSRTDQFMPWIDVGPHGDVHVVFYDRRNDPSNQLLDVYYAHSSDGVTFDPNVRLNEFPINSTFSTHQSGAVFMGDYIGIMEGANGWVHPIWVDTRDGRADAYTTVLVP